MEIELPFFELGPLLSPNGERASVDVVGITCLSDGVTREKAEKIRGFFLKSSEVGVAINTFKRGYTFLPFDGTYILVYTQVGDIFDRVGQAFPILRRCFLIEETTLESLDGFPTAIIKGLESQNFSISNRHKYVSGLQPQILTLGWDLLDVYLTLKEVMEAKAVQLITIFCKLSNDGRVQINDSSLAFYERLQYLEAILAALTFQHRKLISFSTSSTNPQNYELARVIFVDSGTPVSHYEIKPTPTTHLSSRPNGLRYILRLDDIVQNKYKVDLVTFINDLRLPNIINIEPSSLGKHLDLMIEFADEREKISNLLHSNSPTLQKAPLSIAVGLAQKYREMLTSDERSSLLNKELSFFVEQAHSTSDRRDQAQLVTQVLKIVTDNADLRDTDECDYENLVLEKLVEFLVATNRAELLKSIVTRFHTQGSFWVELSELLLQRALEQFVTDDIYQAVEAWWLIYQNNWLNKNKQKTLLEQLLSKKLGVIATIKRFTSSTSEIDILSWLAQDSLMSIFVVFCPYTYKLLKALIDPSLSMQDTHNLLDESFEELDRTSTWLQWGAQKLLEKQHYSSIGEVSIQALLNQGSRGKTILKGWCEKWINQPSLLELVDTEAYKWLYGLSLEEQNLKFAIIIVWSYYAKLSELPQNYTTSAVFNEIKQLDQDFQDLPSKVVQFIDESIPDHKPTNKMIFVGELLEVLDISNPQLAQKYLVGLLRIDNDYLYTASVRRLIKHGEVEWLRENAPHLISNYLGKFIKSVLNIEDPAFEQLSLLSVTVQQRNEQSIKKIYLNKFHSTVQMLFISYRLEVQESFVKALSHKDLSYETRIATSLYMRNLRRYHMYEQWKRIKSNIARTTQKLLRRKSDE